ncbi:GAF and ANTAR domain-containing protein [Oryzobacter sp. R7]|uniref:GAF and ANTAR domain-containing protein n=1 Tax=Oryzobacter faecalis TaxID=3388656 RepID=UPI00398D4DA7
MPDALPSDPDGRTPTSDDLVRLAEAMELVAVRASLSRDEPLTALVTATVERLPGADAASLTVLRGGKFSTEASTGEDAERADALQYEIGSGPCVDAVLDDNVYVTDDVERDERWPEWGHRAHAATGFRSVLAYRLTLLDDSGAIACLNVFSRRRAAFGRRDIGTGLVLATHGSLLVTALVARDRAENLRRALESNREIGVAMGILMQQHRLTREQAFDVLRVASQDANRKLVEVATEVADTGTLTITRWPRGLPDGRPQG